MSESRGPEDKKSLTLASPRRVELKKTVGWGEVRQSFSHGRTRTVQVEVKKKRTIGSDVAPPPAKVRAPAPPPAAAPEASETEAEARPAASKVRVMLRTLTDEEKNARARALEGAQTATAQARAEAEEETRRRAAEEAVLARERDESEQRTAEEEARKLAEEAARRKGEEQAAERLQSAEITEEAPEPVRRRPGRAAGPRPARRQQPRRRAGKFTVSQALNERERTRSLASIRRARERERRGGDADASLPEKVVRDVVLPETIVVQELANRMAERGSDVVKALMNMGVIAGINERIDADTAELAVTEFGHRAKRVSEADVEIGLDGDPDPAGSLKPRPPVVTVMGHVDHGKTTLLDALRETNVAGGEAGGITQHIGAYQIEMPSGKRITFLDTPGHEAFGSMRARGAQVTDIVVLVVAADDGIMPQTIEAINHARAAEVPIVVAINKIDKSNADPARIRRELLQHEVVLEEVGGETLCAEISATEKTGLDKLEEAIALQAEILELAANPDRAAQGVVIESKVDLGRGPVATVLVERGTLAIGDIVVAGGVWGRVRALSGDRGALTEAGPSVPAELVGLNGPPEAGDEFSAVESEARAREISEFRARRARESRIVVGETVSLEDMFSKIKEGALKELPMVVKADVKGSLEAILDAVQAMASDEVAVRALHAAVGGINESDVDLARASNTFVLGFNVRANKQARELAHRTGTEIRYYSVIYQVIDDIKAALSGMLAPTLREHTLGSAEVRDVFNVSKLGRVAGCLVTEGTVKREAQARLLRDAVVIHTGTISSLKRFKEDVREVKEGTECGLGLHNYHDVHPGDVIEVFEIEEIARSL